MAIDRSSFNLFGLDLHGLGQHWRQGWSQALAWPLLARLFPAEPVRLLAADGGESVWSADGCSPRRRRAAAAVAILLPDDIVLRRTLELPLLSHAEERQAVELEVQAASPFPVERVVWGYCAQASTRGRRVELALAAREHVEAHLRTVQASVGGGSPEVWVSGRPPIVMAGFGESARLARQRRARRGILALAGLALLLSLVLIAAPVLQKRQRVFDAQTRFSALAAEVAPVVAQRDALGKVNLRLQRVADYVAVRPDPRAILGRLSVLIPDSAYLTRFEIRGDTVIIGGLAENAAGLMEIVGAQAEFREVRAPAAITRDRSSGRESFTMEFKLADGGDSK